MTEKMCEFDKTMNFMCRILKRADAKKPSPLIERFFPCKKGGFNVVKYKDGKHWALRCVEDLIALVGEDHELWEEMVSKDNSGILKGNGLKYYV